MNIALVKPGLRMVGPRTGRSVETPPPPAPQPPVKVFTQEEVTALATREKAQGERAGQKALAESLGYADVAAMTAAVKAAKETADAALTEAQRKEQAIADRERAATEKEQALASKERLLNRREVLAGLGASGDDLDDAVALLRVADDADAAAVQAAADALKERRPEIFTGGGTVKKPPVTPPGVPSSRPPANGQPQAPVLGAKGAQEAARRWGKQPAATGGASA
jgi:hypothetical protein